MPEFDRAVVRAERGVVFGEGDWRGESTEAVMSPTPRAAEAG